MLPRFYNGVRDSIIGKLRTDQWADWIARKAGIRATVGSSEEFLEFFRFLPPGGEPGDALTKLHTPPGVEVDSEADRKAIGWRPSGQPAWADGFGTTNANMPGQPCNTRSMYWQRLRDNGLRSGVDNGSRFGYAFDRWKSETGGFDTVTSYWWRRAPSSALSGSGAVTGYYEWDLYEYLPFGATGKVYAMEAEHPINAVQQYRITLYCTKATYPWRLKIQHGRGLSGAGFPAGAHRTITTDMGTFTGRYQTDWLIARTDVGITTEPRAPGAALTDFYIKLRVGQQYPTDRPAGTVAQLREGFGFLAIPFAEIEFKTYFVPEATYEIQDDYTPLEWRETEIEQREMAGTWPPEL